MATATGSYVSDNSTLANFKAWCQAISNAFSAFGWVQTADTGQVVWSTIPSVPSSTYVYEVWKANDSQAATMPIFVKVEYGYSSTSPRIRMTAGTGSNGSGTITGGVISSSPWEITNLETNQGATTYPCFFSGDAGEFRMYMWQSVSVNTGVVFGIERSKDTSGNKTASYFTVLSGCSQSNNTNWQQSVMASTAVTARESGMIAVGVTSGSGTGAFGATVASLPVFPLVGQCGNPMLGWQTCCANDVADGSTVTIASLYAATHTFIAASRPNFSNTAGQRVQSSTNMAILMRYE